MNNKQLIKSASWLGLVATTATLIIGNLPHSPTPITQAAHLPNSTPIASITLDSSDEISEIRSDMDSDGNQYYVWIRDWYDLDRRSDCNGVFYQAFNKSGLPITQQTEIESACDPLISFSSPDVTANNANFTITYLHSETGVFTDAKIVAYNKESYSAIEDIQTVNESLTLASTANPRLASSLDGSKIGVAFQSCDDLDCEYYNIHFQGFDGAMAKTHPDNEMINPFAGIDVAEHNIAFSGEHFLVVYQESFLGEPNMIYNVYAKAIGYDANSDSELIAIGTDTARSPDAGGTQDVEISATDTYFESFYVTYLDKDDMAPERAQEVMVKKIFCEYDPLTPANFYCDTTSRDGETVYARAGAPDNTEKRSPQISVFKNSNDLKRSHPYENTNIDYLTIAWTEFPLEGNPAVKAQNFTDTLKSSGSVIIVAEESELLSDTSISSNNDGHFVIIHQTGMETYANIYPTQFLRLDHEEVVHAPDSNAQQAARVAKNSNGDYVIVYQNYNGNDNDIVFALYNKYGNPVKNLTIANETTTGEQSEPAIAYFNEETDSEHFGKFIVCWSGEGAPDADGTYYRIFNADGTPAGAETLVNQNASYLQDAPDISTGRFGQFAIVYREENTGIATIILNYHNDSNIIHAALSSGAAGNRNPKIGLNPVADGTTGSSGNSKFFAAWRDNGSGFITSGYLNSATTIAQNATDNEGAFYTEDLDGAYNEANSSFTPALDPFYYARTAYLIAEMGSGAKLNIGFYGSAYQETEDLTTQWTGASVAVDPATQNIFIIGEKLAGYWPDGEQVLFFPANSPSTLTNEQIFDADLSRTATVSQGFGTHLFIEDASESFPSGGAIGTTTANTVTDFDFGIVLEFATDISTHFTIDQIVSDPTNGGSGKVVGIGTNDIVLEDVSGSFSTGGGTLDNAPYNDSYINVPDSSNRKNLHFASGEGLNFEVGNNISDLTLEDRGNIEYVYDEVIVIREFLGQNIGLEDVLDFNYSDYSTTDSIEYISGNFFRFSVNDSSNTPDWIMAGPTFSVSERANYGQTYNSSDAAYRSDSGDEEGKFVITAYSSNGSNGLLDNNGVYQQLIEDPFSLGQKEDLSPTTEQQITPGGKYIIVPGTIDFGIVNRGNTGVIDLADLTPSCIRVTDLDGTDFDLTVTLTDLTHSTIPTLTIPNSSFIIENNDGINPLVSNLAAFSSADDVSLSTSTNPGMDANLGTAQTLLVKTNPHTGSWKICPRTKLTIPSDADSGTYSGTLTFTLI